MVVAWPLLLGRRQGLPLLLPSYFPPARGREEAGEEEEAWSSSLQGITSEKKAKRWGGSWERKEARERAAYSREDEESRMKSPHKHKL